MIPDASAAAGRPSTCSASAILPARLARIAVRWASDPEVVADDLRHLRCTLERHPGGDHHALVHEATSHSAIWARWPDHDSPPTLLILPDCPATHPAHGGCCAYENHPGGHTWQLDDSREPWLPDTP